MIDLENLHLAYLEIIRQYHGDESLLSGLIDQMDPLLQDRLKSEFYGAGPLEDLLARDEITEILVLADDRIFYEDKGQLLPHADRFLSQKSFEAFIHRLCQEAQVHTDLRQPAVNGKWRSCRLHLIQPPLVETGFQLSLRRHPSKKWTLDQLLDCGWASTGEVNFIRSLVEERKNVLVVGATGSGKTSLLTAMLGEVEEFERTLIIEDTPEIAPCNSVSTRLLTRTDNNEMLLNYLQTDLVRECLRMRPDRLLLGEVRGSEAKDLLLALATGHRGSWGSIHAANPIQALLRLEMLVQMGAPTWNRDSIRQLVGNSLDAIIVVGRLGANRRLISIHELTGVDQDTYLLEPIFNLSTAGRIHCV